MEPLGLLALASDTFYDGVAFVGRGGWAGVSTCTGWTVRDVLDHVVGGNRFAVASLAGQSLDEAFRSALSPGFDGEPADLYSASAADQLRAFRTSGALVTIVDHPMGQITGREFLDLRICDLVLHSWDIARSTGGSEQIDDDLVEFVWSRFADETESVLESGHYGTYERLGDDGSLTMMDRVLLASGRTP